MMHSVQDDNATKLEEPEETDRPLPESATDNRESSTCFRVPELAVSVVGTAEELLAIVVELYVSDSLFVTKVRPNAPPVVVNFPNLRRSQYKF